VLKTTTTTNTNLYHPNMAIELDRVRRRRRQPASARDLSRAAPSLFPHCYHRRLATSRAPARCHSLSFLVPAVAGPLPCRIAVRPRARSNSGSPTLFGAFLHVRSSFSFPQSCSLLPQSVPNPRPSIQFEDPESSCPNPSQINMIPLRGQSLSSS
jgi:hypothetical protein